MHIGSEVNQISPTCNSNISGLRVQSSPSVVTVTGYIGRHATCCYRLNRQNPRCGAIDVLFLIQSAKMEDLIISLQMQRICHNEQPGDLLKPFLFIFVYGACNLKLQFGISSRKRLTADTHQTLFFTICCDNHRFSVISQ